MNRTALFDTGIPQDGILAQTEKAVQIEWNAGSAHLPKFRPIWLPKSQIEWISYSPVFAPTLHIPGWLARKNNMRG